jgi:hypothetical protein
MRFGKSLLPETWHRLITDARFCSCLSKFAARTSCQISVWLQSRFRQITFLELTTLSVAVPSGRSGFWIEYPGFAL